MFLDFLKNINWVDILMMVIFIRIIYIGAKTGFVTEFLKLLGICGVTFVALHYYSSLGELLADKVPFLSPWADLIMFGVLWALFVFAFKLVRDGLLLIFKIEAHSVLNRWGGIVIAIGRGLIICSLVLLSFHISGVTYFKKNVERALTHPFLLVVSLRIYQGIFDGVVSKFFPEEKLNLDVFQLKPQS